jgi:hypothetical protein
MAEKFPHVFDFNEVSCLESNLCHQNQKFPVVPISVMPGAEAHVCVISRWSLWKRRRRTRAEEG